MLRARHNTGDRKNRPALFSKSKAAATSRSDGQLFLTALLIKFRLRTFFATEVPSYIYAQRFHHRERAGRRRRFLPAFIAIEQWRVEMSRRTVHR